MKVVVENGKRKTAEARAIVREGKGEIRLNSVRMQAVQNPLIRAKINEALELAGDLAKAVDIEVETSGGGYMGQAEAARGAIARALVRYSEDEELRKKFIEYDRALMIDDTRRKEPKHYGGQGARAKRQKSYR